MNAAPGDPMAMRRWARPGHSTEALAFPKSASSQAVLAGLCSEQPPGEMEQRDQLHVLGVRASYLAAHHLAKLPRRFRMSPKVP